MKKLLLLLFTLILAGCEVFEEDISEKRVRIISPADRVSVAAGTVDFRWQATAHATGYEFTVVSPSFISAERVFADTVIYADTLARNYGCRLELAAGNYEWSVRGFNGCYATRPEIRAVTVVPRETPEIPDAQEISAP